MGQLFFNGKRHSFIIYYNYGRVENNSYRELISIVYAGFEAFLTRYVLYFLRFITPFEFRSVAASLNILSVMGSLVSPGTFFWCRFLIVSPLAKCTDHGVAEVDGSEGVVCNLGTSIGEETNALDMVSHRVVVVVALFLVLGEASSDNMGNNESSEGVSPAKDGRCLTKFPIVEEERVAFPLYHMNIATRAIIPMPTVINRAKISFGEREKG